MKKCLRVAVTLAVLCTAGVLSHTTCTPDCTGMAYGDAVADPEDCTKYYYCLDDHTPTDASMSCDPGMYFQPTWGYCASCMPQYPDCACPSSCVHSTCHLTCDDNNDFVADPYSCNVFYECSPTGLGPAQHCPSNLPYFDGENCIADPSYCCHVDCSPYCGVDSPLQIPDPVDCGSFYICEQSDWGGPPPEENHFQCPAGSNFVISEGRCVDGAPCQSLCGGTNPPPPFTTTPLTYPPPTSTPNPNSCQNSYLCYGSGYFQACSVSCQPYYFDCSYAGEVVGVSHCGDGFVFSSDPNYPYCVPVSDCHYYP